MQRTEINKYDDFWNDPNHLKSRTGQVLRQLGMIENFRSRNFQSILQIGPGVGAETVALKQLFLGVNILAFDRDPRAAEASMRNLVEFQQIDLLTVEADQFSQIMMTRKIDLVLALRTSPAVIKYLLDNVKRGMIVGSLISGADPAESLDLYHQITARGGRSVLLEQERGSIEFALIKDFG